MQNDGTALKSFLSDNIALQSEHPNEEISLNDIKRVAQQIYGGPYPDFLLCTSFLTTLVAV